MTNKKRIGADIVVILSTGYWPREINTSQTQWQNVCGCYQQNLSGNYLHQPFINIDISAFTFMSFI